MRNNMKMIGNVKGVMHFKSLTHDLVINNLKQFKNLQDNLQTAYAYIKSF